MSSAVLLVHHTTVHRTRHVSAKAALSETPPVLMAVAGLDGLKQTHAGSLTAANGSQALI
jgi:uncharacterized protein YdaL